MTASQRHRLNILPEKLSFPGHSNRRRRCLSADKLMLLQVKSEKIIFEDAGRGFAP